MAADIRQQINSRVTVSAANYIWKKGKIMDKIKYFISWLGEKLFPGLPE